MSREHWIKEIDFDMNFAVSTLVDKGEVRATFIIRLLSDEIVFVPASFEDDERKKHTLTLVSMVCLAHEAVALSFISEAWGRRLVRRHGETAEEQNARAYAVRAREAEDRDELIMAFLSWRDDADELQHMHRCSEILRAPDGRVSGTKDYEMDGDVTGRMSELLPERIQRPAVRAKAIRVLAELGVSLTPIRAGDRIQ